MHIMYPSFNCLVIILCILFLSYIYFLYLKEENDIIDYTIYVSHSYNFSKYKK